MTLRRYQWDDAGAPVLSGTAGALAAVLDVLANGCGSKPGAGWTIEFSDTNRRVYRPGAGLRHRLWLNDTGTTIGRLRGYESMTGIDTGTGPYPTDAQLSGGDYFNKSTAANTTARPWLLLATESWFYLYGGYGDATSSGLNAGTSNRALMFFGDIDTDLPGDQFHSLLMASNSSTNGGNTGQLSATMAAVAGHYMARGIDQTTLSVQYSKVSDQRCGANIGNSGPAYPDPVTGGMRLADVHLIEPGNLGERGRLPNFKAPLHTLPAAAGDTFDGTGELAGRTYILLNACANGPTTCRVALDITGAV